MTSVNIYRVRFTQSQRCAINISAPSPELAEFFAEEIRKQAGARPFEALRGLIEESGLFQRRRVPP
jgi:hypothetical protein